MCGLVNERGVSHTFECRTKRKKKIEKIEIKKLQYLIKNVQHFSRISCSDVQEGYFFKKYNIPIIQIIFNFKSRKIRELIKI